MDQLLESASLDPTVLLALAEKGRVGRLLMKGAELELLVKLVHVAKGRYHTQLAMCNLFDACGLPNVRPKKDTP